MPNPTGSSLHVNQRLTSFGIGYAQTESAGRFARESTTVVPVSKDSDLYNKWNKADFFRLEMQPLADGARAARAGFRQSDENYQVEFFGLEKQITDRQRSRARNELELEEQTVKYLVNQALMRRDVSAAAAAFGTGLWTANTEQTGVSGAAGANQFTRFDESASTPLEVIDAQKQVIRRSVGKLPNRASMGADVMDALRRHADINALYNPTLSGVVSEEQVAAAIGVEKVVVLDSIQNTAKEGLTASMADIYGKHLLLSYVDPGQSMDSPTACATFVWDEFDAGDDEAGISIRTRRDEDTDSDILKVQGAFVTKITANDAGVFMLTAVN